MEGADVIKSFLVGLGFGVDDKELAQFYKAIDSATRRVAAMYGGIQLAAAGIFASITKISAGFEEMGYQLRLVAPAINKFLILRQAMLSAYKQAGINITEAVRQSILFNYSLAKTKFALEAIYKSVAIRFIPLLTKQMDTFRAQLFQNMPHIKEVLEGIIKVLFKAFSATIQIGTTVWHVLEGLYQSLKTLDAATGGWSTRILEFIAAWKILNLGFLATPFGMVIAGIAALIALYDDFKVWQEGGKSFINWGSDTTKMVLGMIAAIAGLAAVIAAVVAALRVYAVIMAVVTAVQAAWGLAMLLPLTPLLLIIAGVTALVGLLSYLAYRFGVFKNIGEWFTGIGEKVTGLFGTGTAGQVVGALAGANQNTVGQVMNPQPLYDFTKSSSQNVSQKTDIIVQGSSDAQSTAKHVANEQGKVNFDLTRNLRGATQ